MRVHLLLSLLLFISISSCKKDTTTYVDEYTGKKMLFFVDRRASEFSWENHLYVTFEKDTIVFSNDGYNHMMPVIIDTLTDSTQFYTMYVQPIARKFRLEVYHEMFGYSEAPLNEINTATLKKIMLNPTSVYGNMICKFVYYYYVKKANGYYYKRKVIFYYDAEIDEYYTM